MEWLTVAAVVVLSCVGTGLACYRMGRHSGWKSGKMAMWGTLDGVTYRGVPLDEVPGFGLAPGGRAVIVIPPPPPPKTRSETAHRIEKGMIP